MRSTDAQVRKLMEEMAKHSKVWKAALRASMHRNTAAKYMKIGALPSELVKARRWRTRPDPFDEDWPGIVARLEEAPELEAKTLFEHLLVEKPDGYEPGQLRTLQRRVRRWRALEGPPKEVFFAQEHRPGEAMQTDFTWANELGITIEGEPFPHLLCHVVLPYSNWEWATVCQSESMVAIKMGVQEAVFRLGRVPEWHQTDNSTAATHDLRTGKRGFNEEYEALMRHLGMKPRTIEVGQKHQNGDVESLNGALKRRLDQHLEMRRSRDFRSLDTYEEWLGGVLEKANAIRMNKVRQELQAMRIVNVARLPEYREYRVTVSAWSTIRVCWNAYSVPSRLVGEVVTVRVYDDRLEVFHSGQHQLTVERLRGRYGHRINYRHVIWSLVQKPGAFERYKYREDLFPTLVFRRTYDALCESREQRSADIEYLRILHQAASTMECDVETILGQLLAQGVAPTADRVKAHGTPVQLTIPEIPVPAVDLSGYDSLLCDCLEVRA